MTRTFGGIGLLALVLFLAGCEPGSQLEPAKPLVELNSGAQLQLCRFTVDYLGTAFDDCAVVPPTWSHDFDACVLDVPWDGCAGEPVVSDWEACVFALSEGACDEPPECATVLCPAP